VPLIANCGVKFGSFTLSSHGGNPFASRCFNASALHMLGLLDRSVSDELSGEIQDKDSVQAAACML
jgi:hypothetical protein